VVPTGEIESPSWPPQGHAINQIGLVGMKDMIIAVIVGDTIFVAVLYAAIETVKKIRRCLKNRRNEKILNRVLDGKQAMGILEE